MKFISSLAMLLIPALAAAADVERDLQIADWHVSLLTVSAQQFTFETGEGGGGSQNVKITVMDKCRMESATRTTVGDFYPCPLCQEFPPILVVWVLQVLVHTVCHSPLQKGSMKMLSSIQRHRMD